MFMERINNLFAMFVVVLLASRSNCLFILNIIMMEDIVLAKIVGKNNCEKIRETFSKLDQSDGCSFSQRIWSLKNKTFPKNTASVPAAKRDINNRLITDPIGLKQLYDAQIS